MIVVSHLDIQMLLHEVSPECMGNFFVICDYQAIPSCFCQSVVVKVCVNNQVYQVKILAGFWDVLYVDESKKYVVMSIVLFQGVLKLVFFFFVELFYDVVFSFEVNGGLLSMLPLLLGTSRNSLPKHFIHFCVRLYQFNLVESWVDQEC